MPLNDINITDLTGVGPKAAKRLHALGIRSVRDLVYYFPREHTDSSHTTALAEVQSGVETTVHVVLKKIQSRRARNRRMSITEARVSDDTGELKVTWFNQPHLADSLREGDELLLSGVVKQTKYGTSMQSPVHEKIANDHDTLHLGRIAPKYSLTWGLTQKQLRYFMKQALERVLPIADHLPAEIIERHSLMPLTEAMQQIHFPDSAELFAAAKRRFEFDELYIIQLASQQIRSEIQAMNAAPLQFHEHAVKNFVSDLPFVLTSAQRRSTWDILQDTQRGFPMNRLLIGDVGSGKTVVAAIAAFNAVQCGVQVAIMAPTAILAQQHYTTLRSLLEQHDISVELWTSDTKTPAAAGQQQLDEVRADVIVGTHALIQEHASFTNLGLAIVDEQHRFGVRQRKQLTAHSGNSDTVPHLLSMTATPIPRSLALALYGDLDLSLINEMPAGRQPVMTRLVPAAKRTDSYGFIREHVAAGEQVFVVCPLVEESEKIEALSVEHEYEDLSQNVFADLHVGMLHGKMKADEKDAIMDQMRRKKIDILVATSVIEVGVDIPDATIMIIENAERFGLAQLHQFRGRVGRSDKQSYCFLFTQSRSPLTQERLQALVDSNDGFALAQKDLELRGAGEVYGTMQSGVSKHSILSLQQPELIEEAQVAARLTFQDNLLDTQPLLQKKLTNFVESIHLE